MKIKKCIKDDLMKNNFDEIEYEELLTLFKEKPKTRSAGFLQTLIDLSETNKKPFTFFTEKFIYDEKEITKFIGNEYDKWTWKTALTIRTKQEALENIGEELEVEDSCEEKNINRIRNLKNTLEELNNTQEESLFIYNFHSQLELLTKEKVIERIKWIINLDWKDFKEK